MQALPFCNKQVIRFKLEKNEIWKVWPKAISSEEFLASYASIELQRIVKLYIDVLRDSLNKLEGDLEELQANFQYAFTKVTEYLRDFERSQKMDEEFIM